MAIPSAGYCLRHRRGMYSSSSDRSQNTLPFEIGGEDLWVAMPDPSPWACLACRTNFLRCTVDSTHWIDEHAFICVILLTPS